MSISNAPINPDFEIENGVLISYKGESSNVVIPSSVTTIGLRAFYECDWIESITIGSSVRTIEPSAFVLCTSLKEIIIPSSVTGIDDRAFCLCESLERLTISRSVRKIGHGICASCPSLKEIIVEDGNPRYCTIDGNLYTKDKKTLVQYAIGKKDTSFTIPSSVTSIGDSAFSGCTLGNITIPNSVTSIGRGAFYVCLSLTSITIPSSVKSIGDDTFAYCENLKTVYNHSHLDIEAGSDDYGMVAYYAENVYND